MKESFVASPESALLLRDAYRKAHTNLDYDEWLEGVFDKFVIFLHKNVEKGELNDRQSKATDEHREGEDLTATTRA